MLPKLKSEHYAYFCPCCGQETPKRIGVKPNGRYYFGAQQQALFDAVKKSPEGISHDALRERLVKEGRDPHLVYVMIVQINKKIRPWNLKIKNKGRLYYLVQLQERYD